MEGQLSWMVGGQQGEGIESTGTVLAGVLNRLGYHIYGYRTFSSRIKGGHTNFKIRIAGERVLGMDAHTDILVAFDQESITRNAHQLVDGSAVIFDSSGGREADIPSDRSIALIDVPMTEVAREAGAVIMKNMVGTGASAAVLGLEPHPFLAMIEEQFGGKGHRLVEANRHAFMEGYRRAAEAAGDDAGGLTLPPGDGRRRHLMSGDDAVAFGALAGGCRLLAAYPISPATEIMHWLIKKLPEHGGVVVQAEDEIAAITMAIGAGYAGVRAMTSTSGPGLSLMMEALGYAGVIESPLVIVNVQRGGPSTGLPTKHEQSDLYTMVYGSHGDLPRIVLSPTTVEECFYYGAEAFNLSEQYQVPVIIAMDMAIGLCMQTVDDLDFSRVTIDRGRLLTQEQLDELNRLNGHGRGFLRYQFTDTGVSPRSIPGQAGGLHLATGVEHDESGHITDDPVNRNKMTEKRLTKVARAETPFPPFEYDGGPEPDVLLIGWGSTVGPLSEAMGLLRRDGIDAALGAVKLLSPLPAEAIAEKVSRASKVIVAENNAQGQLTQILRQHLPGAEADKLDVLLKYDGNPFIASEIAAHCREVL